MSETLDQKFQIYHMANPHIFQLFRSFAGDIKKAGYKNFGAKAIMELVRWELSVNSKDPMLFKINNNYTSRYVRLLEQKDPSFIGFFRKRRLREEAIITKAENCVEPCLLNGVA